VNPDGGRDATPAGAPGTDVPLPTLTPQIQVVPAPTTAPPATTPTTKPPTTSTTTKPGRIP
jgi:hypothetical protein